MGKIIKFNLLSDKVKQILNAVWLFILTAYYICVAVWIFSCENQTGTQYLFNILVYLLTAFFGIVLQYCCVIDKYTKIRNTLFNVMLFVLNFITVTNALRVSLSASGFAEASSALLVAVGLSDCVFITLEYLYFRQIKQCRFGIADVLVIASVVFYAVVILINAVSPIRFVQDEYFLYNDFLLIAVPYLFIALSMIIFAVANQCTIKTRLTLLEYLLFPMLFVVASVLIVVLKFSIAPESLGNFAYTLMMYVIFFHLYQEQSLLLISQENELTEKKTQIMFSQIQPHFLYNALSAIAAIPNNPTETRDALSVFGRYLRGNLNSLSQNVPISFSQELKHIQTYLQLEKLRFEDKLMVEYDLQYTDFSVPALSVQIFVENAVKHGITKRPHGGHLLIKSECVGNDCIVTVKDDGVGFNALALDLQNDTHVGIKNARARLKSTINGNVEIISDVGEGTTVIITVPKTTKYIAGRYLQ